MSFCNSIPGCPNPCAPNISASSLNSQLIPTFLQGMSSSQQCAYIEASTNSATIFRAQVAKFLGQIANAKRQLSARRTVCPVRIPWSVSNPPLIVNQRSQANYYDFFIGARTGFAFIMGKVLAFLRKQRICRQRLKDGRSICDC